MLVTGNVASITSVRRCTGACCNSRSLNGCGDRGGPLGHFVTCRVLGHGLSADAFVCSNPLAASSCVGGHCRCCRAVCRCRVVRVHTNGGVGTRQSKTKTCINISRSGSSVRILGNFVRALARGILICSRRIVGGSILRGHVHFSFFTYTPRFAGGSVH